MKKILFVASHRFDRAPGQRFRFEQYFQFLAEHGYSCELSFFIDEKSDKIIYKPGHYFQKLKMMWNAFSTRFKNVRHRNDYDIIFIFREAMMLGTIYFEKKFKDSRAKLVFDFDDAIWHMDMSEANKRFHFLKNPAKTGDIIRLCDLVFAGNAYLANYASQFNSNVVIVPTTIDTSEYQRVALPKNDFITIGWSGSVTTIKHFEYALPFLQEIKKIYGDKIRIKVIGDASYKNEELGVQGIAWTRKDEVPELSGIDIGIMPLPDDEWANGKCGLKGLQYMALEIPTIMSPVGVNKEIIRDGENGFLAESTEQWISKLKQLIESESMRTEMGKKARQTVLDHYSVLSQQENYLRYFNQLTAK
ncbi:MAG: glycosyltransferase family 4 protein [Bacteroidia bacterium]